MRRICDILGYLSISQGEAVIQGEQGEGQGMSETTGTPSAGTQRQRAFYKALGRRLATARVMADLQQQEVTHAVSAITGREFSYQAYGAWENGRNVVAADILVALAKALGQTVNSLLGIPEPGGFSSEELAMLEDYRQIQNEGLRKLARDAVKVQMRADADLRRTRAAAGSPLPENERSAPAV